MSKMKHSISYGAFAEDCDNLEDFQRQTLWKLNDWAEMLFGVDELDFDNDDIGENND